MVRAKKAAPVKMGVNTGNNLPAVPPGLPYGQRQAATSAIAAVPVAGPSSAPAPNPAPGGPATAPPNQNQMASALAAYQPPAGDLMGDTGRPGEPVTSGLPSGPGAGPETMGGVDPQTNDVLAWKPYLPTLEFMASQPDATMSTRQFVRRLRSMMPINPPPGTAPPGPQ